MDPLSIASLALSAAPGIFKGITGLFQRGETVQRTDTTPAAFTEALALKRQAANSALMPGYGQRANALAQGQAASVQNAALGSASSGDFLASAQAADARNAQGQQQLGIQAAQYHDQATRALDQGLQQQAQYQVADNNRYNQANAALKGNGLSNIFGGLSDAASAGVYAIGQYKNPTAASVYGSSYPGSSYSESTGLPRAPRLFNPSPISTSGFPR